MREMVDATMNRLVPWISSLPQHPMHKMDGARRAAAALVEPMPERGAPFRRLLSTVFERALPWGLATASPGYLAYIPGGGLFHAAVADLIADATNRYVGLWSPAPGLVQLESNVIRWFCEMAGFGAESGGILTTGGSLANLGAVVTARHERLPTDFLRGTLYCTRYAHHSVLKAARIAGFPEGNVRVVPVDGALRMRPGALAAQLAADRADGWQPALVVASAGTTATGAVDPLPALADLCELQGLWLHVDAAYGGFFLLTERGRARLTGIERAHSITLDPHKGLFLPYGTGALIVRDREALVRAHRVTAAYLPPSQSDPARWDFADMGPELSRDGRGLRVWLPLKMHGAAAFRAALDEKLDLAAAAAAQIAEIPALELVGPPELSLFAFRWRHVDPAEGDARTRRLLTRINARQRVFLTGTEVEGRFAARVCVLSFRTHQASMDHLMADLAAALADVEAAHGPG